MEVNLTDWLGDNSWAIWLSLAFLLGIAEIMGAVFSLPWARLKDWRGAPEMLAAAGFFTVALALAPDAVELEELAASIPPQAKLAVLLGTEGAGLSNHWSDGAAVRTRIPMFAGIDSLNVAAAAAIACYALSSRGVTGQSSG